MQYILMDCVGRSYVRQSWPQPNSMPLSRGVAQYWIPGTPPIQHSSGSIRTLALNLLVARLLCSKCDNPPGHLYSSLINCHCLWVNTHQWIFLLLFLSDPVLCLLWLLIHWLPLNSPANQNNTFLPALSLHLQTPPASTWIPFLPALPTETLLYNLNLSFANRTFVTSTLLLVNVLRGPNRIQTFK